MDKLTRYQNNAFSIFIILTYIIYIASAIGISKTAPVYLDDFDYYVKIYISLFLLWRFNMFRKIEFNELDRKIAFSAGLFLFTSTAVYNILTSYFKTTEKNTPQLIRESFNYAFIILLVVYAFYIGYRNFFATNKK
jgi:hypothetical protein